MTRTPRWTRREFLARGAALAGAAALARPAAAGVLTAGRPGGAPVPDADGLRALGRTGLRVPAVNMGVMNAFLPELVRRSVESGVRLFDTSGYYQRGNNEAMIGRVLEEMKARDDVVLVTKHFIELPLRPKLAAAEVRDEYLKAVEASLRRLRTDRIDVFLFHNMQTVDEARNPGVLEAMARLKKDGKIRASGFSSHLNMRAVVDAAAADGAFDVAEVAFNYAMAGDAPYAESLGRAAAAGMGVIAMKTQCAQFWYRDMVPPDQLAFYRGAINHTAVLKWAVGHPFVATAIPGYTTFEQMDQALSVLKDPALTPDERRFLEDRGVRAAVASYCVQCARCEATCPRRADVPALMRAHLYAFAYRNGEQARAALDGAAPGRGLDACAACAGGCAASCARAVPVAARVGELLAVPPA